MADQTEYDYLIGSAFSAESVEAGLTQLVAEAEAARDAAQVAQTAAETALASTQTARDAAQAAQTAAETAKNGAETAETNAANSASTATNAASNAQTSETNAANSAQTAANEAAKLLVNRKEVTGTSYTVVAADDGKLLVFTSASAVQVTLPEQATETLSAGFQVGLVQKGAGQVSLLTEGTDSLENIDNHAKLEAQYATAYVYLDKAGAPNTWILSGRTAP